ncbi:MAG: hypothetical protein JW862_15485, partial [Anaerolineales bacterium]|nr:hypothetical protein [Anaerolineales bacterium]
HSNPTYVEEDVIHYCIPNMTGVLGRTATHVLNNASWPYVKLISEIGLEKALAQSPALKRGLYTHQAEIIHPSLQAALEGRSIS